TICVRQLLPPPPTPPHKGEGSPAEFAAPPSISLTGIRCKPSPCRDHDRDHRLPAEATAQALPAAPPDPAQDPAMGGDHRPVRVRGVGGPRLPGRAVRAADANGHLRIRMEVALVDPRQFLANLHDYGDWFWFRRGGRALRGNPHRIVDSRLRWTLPRADRI